MMSDYDPMGDEPLRSCVYCGFMFSMGDCDEDEEVCEECRMYCKECGKRIYDVEFELEDLGEIFCSWECLENYKVSEDAEWRYECQKEKK